MLGNLYKVKLQPLSMKKKGVGHIEFILSFLLFISATTLALYFFSPAYKTEIISSSLSYSYDSIINDVSVQVEVYYIKGGDTNSPVSINIPKIADKGIRIECGDNKINYGINGNNVCYPFCKLSEVYVSNEITSSGDYSCVKPKEGEIVSTLPEKMVSEKKIAELAKENYATIKQDLSIPSGNDFSFSLKLSDRNISIIKEPPRGLNVYSRSNRIKVLREDGRREYAEFQVRVW